ncbi:MAG: hypothetical protein KTR25_11490 [Myxococcales bacterium]|nr:hypothetical protein [Myxococcales bacterium]
MPNLTPELVEKALNGNTEMRRVLVRQLTPVIQRQANALLLRMGRATRESVQDLTQHMFLILWADKGRVLRDWDPEKGASLNGWIRLVTERRLSSLLISGRQSGHAEDAQEPTHLERHLAATPSPEASTIARQTLELIFARLKERLTDRGYEMFRMLYVERQDVAWIVENKKISRESVYTWRLRLKTTIADIYKDLESDHRHSAGKRTTEQAVDEENECERTRR